MKILIVCQHFYPEQFRINDIAFELVNRGHDVTVLTGLPNYPEGKIYKGYRWFRKHNEIINGVKIKRTSIPGRGNSNFKLGLNYLSFAIVGSIKALFMKKDFDLVYVYEVSPITMTWPAIVVKAIKNIPLIIHCLDQWPISVTAGNIKKSSLTYKILYKISVFSYKEAEIITISSKSFKQYFENELYISAKDKDLTYWPSYAEDTYANTKNVDNGMFDLVFAGNIGPAQSVETIVEAANLLKEDKDIFFHIVGDGLSKSQCEELAKKYNLNNIKFYGFYPVSEMDQFYNLADAFLITMLNNEIVNTTLPAKAQSYMLAGKPTIGAVSGEVKNVIEESDCGICCESLDYKSLAENIKTAKEDKHQQKKWGDNAKKYYNKNFKKSVCMDNLKTIFTDALEKHKSYKQTNLIKFIKFAVSGGLCMVLDLILFSIFNYAILCRFLTENVIFISTICARIISSLINYFLNKKIVFDGKEKSSFLKYYALVIIQMIISGFIVQSIANLTNFLAVLIKIVADICIFIANYIIQNLWVFRKGKKC